MHIQWPPNKTTSIDDLLLLHKSACAPFEETFAPSAPSINLGTIHSHVLTDQPVQDTYCRRFVVDITSALVYKGAGFVMNGANYTGTLLYNACIDPIVCFGEWSNIHKDLPSDTVRILDGTTLVLSGTWGNNFYHFIYETIGRCAAFERLCYSFSDVDAIIFSYPISNFSRQWFDLLGITDKVIVAPSCFLYCKRLLLPSLSTCGASLETISYLRNRVSLCRGQKKRVFVCRGQAKNGRMAVNEDDIFNNFFKSYGFEKVRMDTLSVQEQANLFASASHIVAPNGGALSNVAFASPGTKLLEFFGESYINSAILRIANQVNVKHYHFICKEVNQKGHFSDYFIDIKDMGIEQFMDT